MSRLEIDLVDFSKNPCEVGEVNYRYVLSILDVCTRYLWLYPLADKRCATVAIHLEAHFYDWGTPQIVQCDRGTEFGREVDDLVKANGGRLIKSSAYHPQSQGKVQYT